MSSGTEDPPDASAGRVQVLSDLHKLLPKLVGLRAQSATDLVIGKPVSEAVDANLRDLQKHRSAFELAGLVTQEELKAARDDMERGAKLLARYGKLF